MYWAGEFAQFFPGANFVGGSFVELTALDKIIYQVATNHLNLESVCDDRKFEYIYKQLFLPVQIGPYTKNQTNKNVSHHSINTLVD